MTEFKNNIIDRSYKQLDFIHGSENAYVPTDIILESGMGYEVQFKVNYQNVGSYPSVFGVCESSNGFWWWGGQLKELVCL